MPGLLNTLIRPRKSGKRYYGVMKHGLMVVITGVHGLRGAKVKNMTLHALYSALLAGYLGGCFGPVLMALKRGLVCFGRKNGVLLIKNPFVSI